MPWRWHYRHVCKRIATACIRICFGCAAKRNPNLLNFNWLELEYWYDMLKKCFRILVSIEMNWNRVRSTVFWVCVCKNEDVIGASFQLNVSQTLSSSWSFFFLEVCSLSNVNGNFNGNLTIIFQVLWHVDAFYNQIAMRVQKYSRKMGNIIDCQNFWIGSE